MTESNPHQSAVHNITVIITVIITTTVDIKPNRIGIDTGAYATNKLTALVLEATTRRLLATE